jgi:single-strand DNA-binding protein
LRKGSSVHVEGSLKMDTWDDKNTGEKRSKIRVHADRVQFLDARRGDSAAASGGEDEHAGPPAEAPRRGGSASGRAGASSASEPRGNPNGAGGSGYPASSAPDHQDPTRAEDGAEDDVPF